MKQSKDRIIRDIKNLLEQKEDYYKPVRVGSYIATFTLNMKLMVIEINLINQRMP